jgi:hypothetical protein
MIGLSCISLGLAAASESAQTPSEIAFWMQVSPNPEVQRWGYRLEVALSREGRQESGVKR